MTCCVYLRLSEVDSRSATLKTLGEAKRLGGWRVRYHPRRDPWVAAALQAALRLLDQRGKTAFPVLAHPSGDPRRMYYRVPVELP